MMRNEYLRRTDVACNTGNRPVSSTRKIFQFIWAKKLAEEKAAHSLRRISADVRGVDLLTVSTTERVVWFESTAGNEESWLRISDFASERDFDRAIVEGRSLTTGGCVESLPELKGLNSFRIACFKQFIYCHDWGKFERRILDCLSIAPSIYESSPAVVLEHLGVLKLDFLYLERAA